MLRAVIAFLAVAALIAAEPLPYVVVLLSYHRGQPWEDNIAASLSEVLADHAEPVFIHLDHKRFPDAANIRSRLDVAAETIAVARPRLVIAADDYAWTLAVQHRDRLAPNLPLIFCGVNHWDKTFLPENATGIVESFDPTETLAMALTVQPEVKRIVVLCDTTETGLASRATLEAVLPAAALGREVVYIGEGTFAETEAALAALDPQHDTVLMFPWNIDSTGATQGHEVSVRRARAVCSAAMWGVWDFQFGYGIVGGGLFDARVHGRETGELALRVLAGEPASSIPVHDLPRTRRVIDARELTRFGIAPGSLPPDIEVIGLPPQFWREHGLLVAAGIAIFVTQAATIAGLLVAMRRRKRAEKARREAEARLRVGSRMDAVGQLAAGVAHDFNNVLTAILGHADLLGLRLTAQDPLRTHVETIAGAAQRAAGTVRNLLSFARGRSQGASSCDTARLVQDVVSLLTHAIDRRIAVDCQLDEEVGSVRIGADELQQVLVNLALNARDAMPDGGRLTISAQREELEAQAEALDLLPGSYVRIEVADTGCGILPEHIERVFDPFFTTKELGKGTGLGLSVVHGAVRAAHGAIRVESKPGAGARFRIWLPASNGASSSALPVVTTETKLRLMLVDDDPLVLEVVGALLVACGATVHQFDDPAKASAWFAGNGLEVDLALLDGNMPGLTGWQLAARLKEARPDLPVVALTGAATPEAQEAWRASGVTRILQKPVTREQLMAMLADMSEVGSGSGRRG